VRVGALGSAIISSLALAAMVPVAAAANGTGGALAGSTSTAGQGSQAKPSGSTVPKGAAPITARSPSLAYSGPVYEKTASGEVVPYQPSAPSAEASSTTGGSPQGAQGTQGAQGAQGTQGAQGAASDTKPQLLVPGSRARYVKGLAAAPMSAPAAVQEIIWAGNQIVGLPYIYGGGHGSFVSPGYDCSGTVSYALHGASLLAAPEDSSELMNFSSEGVGRWVTIFSNPEHAYMDVAGLRLDTSPANDPSDLPGPRWRPLRPANSGFVIRHPQGL
jgi:cell wall-associated NlpC family hydrolase